jgi:hypothetical protein
MRGAMLASVIVIGSVSVSMAFPVAPQSAAPEAVSTYGCHHTYVQDATGWHRHTRECQTLRGVVGRKNRPRHTSPFVISFTRRLVATDRQAAITPFHVVA